MVTPKAGNKRRGGGGASGGNKMVNKRFKPNMGSIGVTAATNMFQTSQIPDNPGYLDFNDPLQAPVNVNNRSHNLKGNKTRPFKRNQGGIGNGISHKMRQSNGGPSNSRGNWGNNKGNANNRNIRSNNRGNQIPPVQMGLRMGGRRIPMGSPAPPIPMMGGHMPPIPPPSFMPSRMGPGPMRPPPMMRPPMPPLVPRGLPRVMPVHRMGLRNSHHDSPPNLGGPMRRGKPMLGGLNKGKGRKIISNNNRGNATPISIKNRSSKRIRPGSSKKTLKEIINQYSLDKPWVTEEIKAEAKKKEDIENRLKGKKDDKLFADFKIQRDKFVAMYEAAKKDHNMEKKKKPQKVSNNETNESDKGEKNANTAAAT